MKGTVEKIYACFRNLIKCFLDYKAWWLAPMLFTLILAVLVVLHLIKYNNNEFIYSLF